MARVFVVETNQAKIEELIEYLLDLTWAKAKLTHPGKKPTDPIGRGIFRFSGLDFQWVKAGDWSKFKHQGEPLKKRGGWE